MWTQSHQRHMPRGKAAVCCILPRGIVWTHLNNAKQNLTHFTIMRIDKTDVLYTLVFKINDFRKSEDKYLPDLLALIFKK